MYSSICNSRCKPRRLAGLIRSWFWAGIGAALTSGVLITIGSAAAQSLSGIQAGKVTHFEYTNPNNEVHNQFDRKGLCTRVRCV